MFGGMALKFDCLILIYSYKISNELLSWERVSVVQTLKNIEGINFILLFSSLEMLFKNRVNTSTNLSLRNNDYKQVDRWSSVIK